MLLSDLAGKEIINLYDGEKLGLIGEADLTISANGNIEAIILNSRGGIGGFFNNSGERESIVIPWQAVKKVGSEVIIVDMHSKSEKMNRYSV